MHTARQDGYGVEIWMEGARFEAGGTNRVCTLCTSTCESACFLTRYQHDQGTFKDGQKAGYG